MSRFLLNPNPDSPRAASHLPGEGNVAVSRLAREAATAFKPGDRVHVQRVNVTATVMTRDELHWCAPDRTPIVYDDEDFIRHCPTERLYLVRSGETK